MGLNIPKKKYTNNFKEHLTIILKKMCSMVGADYDRIEFNDPKYNWYESYCWNSEDDEKEFTEWLSNYMYTNAKARRELMSCPIKRKDRCKQFATHFVSWYGWINKKQ